MVRGRCTWSDSPEAMMTLDPELLKFGLCNYPSDPSVFGEQKYRPSHILAAS
ncbi:hypothetical protein PGTUg99_027870 [Puccinia graminis f. sp. tritici]|uniref:Uncharacterized protein n=1 Tax=Puccinia graminis f. sp. tritici TaxID=56615 RepID=A0A5B0SBL2_PUCGR|nr:hypothetical protein PGTUg99_027870 [Puccinia graminis f. sp. tritici]